MAETRQRRGGTLGFVVGIAIAIPATIFALSNLESADVEFLGWQAQVPLWAVIGLSLLAGGLLGIVVLLAWQARRKHGKKKAIKRAERETQVAEADEPDALPAAGTGDAPLGSSRTDRPAYDDPSGSRRS